MTAPRVRVLWVERDGGDDALLTRLLAAATGRPVELERDALGKPRLAGGGPAFAWSHAEDVAVLALCDAAEVGVDVERVREVPDALAVARTHLPSEVPALRALREPERTEAFLRAWCRHEARLKCLGCGLAAPAPRDPVRVVDLPAPRGHVAALAVRAASR